MIFLGEIEKVALGDTKNFQEIQVTNNTSKMVTLLRNGKGWMSHNTDPKRIMEKLKSPLDPEKDAGTRVVVLSKRMRYHASYIGDEILIIVYSR